MSRFFLQHPRCGPWVLLSLCLGFGYNTFSRSAQAEMWAEPTVLQGGGGGRLVLDSFILSPSLVGQVGYTSNLYRRSSAQGANILNGGDQHPAVGAYMMRFRPSLRLSTQMAREAPLFFVADIRADYSEFTGSSLPANTRTWGMHGDTRLSLFPDRPWQANLSLGYRRIPNLSVLGVLGNNFDKNVVSFGGDLVANPNKGTLDWRLGYQGTIEQFAEDRPGVFNNESHTIQTRGRWKFRPRTALVCESSLAFHRYTRGGAGNFEGWNPLRARVGLSGLVTQRFALQALGGYGATFGYNSRLATPLTQYDGFLAQAEGTFFFGPLPRAQPAPDPSLAVDAFRFGYAHDFQKDYLSGFHAVDRVYGGLRYVLTDRLIVSMEASLSWLAYPEFLFPDGSLRHAPATDKRIQGEIHGEYKLASFLALTPQFFYAQSLSPIQLPEGDGKVFDFNWKQWQIFLGVRLFL